MIQAKDIMTSNPMTCNEKDSVIDAAMVMKRLNTGVVPVIDNSKRCVGIITDRDLCIRILAERKDSSTLVSEVMSTNLLTCQPEDDLIQVLRQMEGKQVKRILVVDEKRNCLGVISEADIAQRVKGTNSVGELAEKIYR